MELKNQIVEMDALAKTQKLVFKRFKKNWNVKVLKWIEIPLPKLKFKKNCPWELTVFNFHSRKLRFENMWICIWCQNLQAKSGTRNDLYSWKELFQNQTWPVKSMSNHYKNDIPNQYLKSILKSIKKFNIFSENVIFQLILKKSIKKDQININKKSI